MINSLLFYTAIFLDLSTVALVVPFFDVYLKALDIPVTDVGYYMSIYGICQTIALPLAGFAAEKFGRRPLLLLSMFGTATSYFVKLQAISLQSKSLFVLSRFLTGLLRHTMTVASAMALDEAGRDEAARAQSLSAIASAASLGFVISPTIGGFLLDKEGPIFLGYCSVTIGVIAGILALFATRNYVEVSLVEEREHDRKHEKKENPLQQLFSAIKKIWNHGNSSRFLALAMVFNSISYIISQNHTSLFLRSNFNFSSSSVGLTISTASFLAAICQYGGVTAVTRSNYISPRNFLLVATCIGSFGSLLVVAASSILFSSYQLYYVGLIISSLMHGTVDSMARASLSTYFANHSALAMSIIYSIDGANRFFFPLINPKLISLFDSINAPMILSAFAAVSCSMFHSFGGTATHMKNKVD